MADDVGRIAHGHGHGNPRPHRGDWTGVDCPYCRTVLSAALDGEATADERDGALAHLVSCPLCQAYRDQLEGLHRLVRLRPADPVPDLTAAIVARARPPQPGPRHWVRWALVVVASAQLILALPDLVLGEDGGVTLHVARHAGSLMAAMAVGLIYVAWRPQRAFGVLPIASALAACMVVTAVLDSADGEVHALGEVHHVLEVAGLVLVWTLAGRPWP